jgi:hypothetical protein
METSFQQRDFGSESVTEVRKFLAKLDNLEGNETPLTHPEWTTLQTSPSFQAQLWTIAPSPEISPKSSLVGLEAYLSEDDPELFTASLPEHREMSLFLPMMRWADLRAMKTHPAGNLTVWAWEHDICTPYLLLRLNFVAGGERVSRGDAVRVPYIAPVGLITALG